MQLTVVYACTASRGGIDLLNQSGYVDCFRSLCPDTKETTWPASIDASSVDGIFAGSKLAQQLTAVSVIVESKGVAASQANDHLPIFAEFGTAQRITFTTKQNVNGQ